MYNKSTAYHKKHKYFFTLQLFLLYLFIYFIHSTIWLTSLIDKDRKAGWKCPSCNYSETRGKCRFEIENAPEKCNRVHECSYCKAKQLTPVDHQRHFCRKRLAEEEG